MAEDWLADVRHHAPDADENVVAAIVRYLGIALRNRDSSLVSFSDATETARVRTNFLRKKLALTAPDEVLDQGIEWVKGLMAGDRTRNRVTVYYLLAHYFGKLDLFGGPAGTSAASLGGPGGRGIAAAAGLGAAGAALAGAAREPLAATPATPPPAAPRAAADLPPAPHAPRVADVDSGGTAGSGWPGWLTWLLIALAVIALILLVHSCLAEKPAADNVAATDATVPAIVDEGNVAVPAAGSAAVAVPAGAGVVSEVRDDKPMLTVYFDSGKAAVSNDLAGASAALKAYLDSHAGSSLAISGYNDPSGNAALNAELSKNRAQAVAAALAAAGIAEGSIALVKPADTTSATVTPEQARRVEVTVQ